MKLKGILILYLIYYIIVIEFYNILSKITVTLQSYVNMNFKIVKDIAEYNEPCKLLTKS